MTIESLTASVPTLLAIWAVFTAGFVGLITYRSQLVRYEDDQLFLAENNATAIAEQRQGEIIRRIQRIDPFLKLLGGVAVLLTAIIVSIWVAEAWHTLH